MYIYKNFYICYICYIRGMYVSYKSEGKFIFTRQVTFDTYFTFLTFVENMFQIKRGVMYIHKKGNICNIHNCYICYIYEMCVSHRSEEWCIYKRRVKFTKYKKIKSSCIYTSLLTFMWNTHSPNKSERGMIYICKFLLLLHLLHFCNECFT